MLRFGKVVFVAALLGTVGAVQAEGLGIALRAGTLGGGLEATTGLSERFAARFVVQGYNYAYSAKKSNVDYKVDLGLASGGAFLDWHPFAGDVRLTLGAVYNQNQLDMTAKSAVSYQIGNATYTAADVGALTGAVKFQEAAPYFGVGWGNAVNKEDFYTFTLDVGVLFQGKPNVMLATTGALASNPTFQADLANEKARLVKSLDSLQAYPVVMLGFAYRFN